MIFEGKRQNVYLSPSLPKSPKYLVSRYLDPLKAEPQEMFVGSNTYSQSIWKTREGMSTQIRQEINQLPCECVWDSVPNLGKKNTPSTKKIAVS